MREAAEFEERLAELERWAEGVDLEGEAQRAKQKLRNVDRAQH